MEYEIADDPQGEIEHEESRRDGGIEHDKIVLRRADPHEYEEDLIAEHQQLQG